MAVVEVHDAPPSTAANVRAALASLAAAADAGADLALYPELFLSGYYLDHAMTRRAAEAAEGLDRLQEAVDETGTSAVVGAALLGGRAGTRGGTPSLDPLAAPLPSGRVLLNGVAVLRPRREPQYAIKAHLYGDEKEWFTPGHDLWTGRIADWPCGIAVCYEIGFPEVARSLALGDAELLLVPSAFGRARARIWDVLTRARAIENGCYVAAAGQAGESAGRHFLGRSRIVDPFGEVVAGYCGAIEECDEMAGDAPHVRRVGPHLVVVAELSPEHVAAARRGDDGWHRSLADRRPRLYERLIHDQT